VIVPSWSVRRTVGGKPWASLPAAREAMSWTLGPAARSSSGGSALRPPPGNQQIRALPVQPSGGHGLGFDIKVAEVAEGPARRSDHPKREVRRADDVAWRTGLGGDRFQGEAGDLDGGAGVHALDPRAACGGFECGGAPRRSCQIGVRDEEGGGGTVEAGETADVPEGRRRDSNRVELQLPWR